MPEVSDTAAVIARIRADEDRLPAVERLFDDPYAHLFAGGAEASEIAEKYLRAPFFREYVRLRTRKIDDLLRDAVAAGIDQILVPGAGYDTRCLRVAEIAERAPRVYEIDQADVIAEKRRVIERAAIPHAGSVRYVATDFTDDDWQDLLAPQLRLAGFRTGSPALVVAEGFAGYLPDRPMRDVLAWLDSFLAPGSRGVFAYPAGRIVTGTFAELARRSGIRSAQEIAFDEIHREYLDGEPPPGGDLYRIAILELGRDAS